MKVKVITHSQASYQRERLQDLPKLRHNPDPLLHPFEKAREVKRALNAVKLERLFAKPFLGSLTGHTDGVYALGKHMSHLTALLSGSADGELRVWDMSRASIFGNSADATSRNSKEGENNDGGALVWSKRKAHSMFIRGVVFLQNGRNTNSNVNRFLSCSDDATIKLWDTSENGALLKKPYCVHQYLGDQPFSGIDHHYHDSIFVTCGSAIHVWNPERSTPIQTFEWGHDTITSVRFNVTETTIFAGCATDRSILLYDLRMKSPLSKVILPMRSNALCWNPMEAFNFTVANEDTNCYSFDMRRLDRVTNILKDHVSAVLDLDYSPTGQEIVTGSYDRSLRIFNVASGHSRDIYHTKRMQKLFCVKYSMDNKYLLSGSDDGNIRLWRATASERFGYKNNRQEEALKYAKALKDKYKEIPEIKRIAKHRHVPKPIISAQKERRIMEESAKRKEQNRRSHSKPGSVPFENKRTLAIIRVQK